MCAWGCSSKAKQNCNFNTQFTYNATILTKQFLRNLSKLYVDFLHFIPTNSYQKKFSFESPIPKIPKKAHIMRFLEIFREIVLEVKIMCINHLYSYCETILHRQWATIEKNWNIFKKDSPGGPGPHFGANLWKSASTWIDFSER